jgi:hypothetical protein
MSAPGVIMSAAALAVAFFLAIVGGFGSGSILAMLVALVGASIAGWGTWKGMQAEKQTGAALNILLLLVNLGFAALMLILKVIDWL